MTTTTADPQFADWISTLVAAPQDHLQKRIFADFLEERDEPAMAEGMRWAAREGKWPEPANDLRGGWWSGAWEGEGFCELDDELFGRDVISPSDGYTPGNLACCWHAFLMRAADLDWTDGTPREKGTDDDG